MKKVIFCVRSVLFFWIAPIALFCYMIKSSNVYRENCDVKNITACSFILENTAKIETAICQCKIMKCVIFVLAIFNRSYIVPNFVETMGLRFLFRLKRRFSKFSLPFLQNCWFMNIVQQVWSSPGNRIFVINK